MKKTFLCGLMLATAISGNAYAQNIFEALSQAYETNPTLQAQRAYLRAIDENVAIAKSGYRPTVSLNGTYADNNTDVKNSVGNPDGDRYSYSAKISQPLFNGLQTINSVKSADSMVLSEQNNLYNVEQTVFIDASTAYLDVVQNKAIVDLQKNNEKLLKKRLDETVQRFNVAKIIGVAPVDVKAPEGEIDKFLPKTPEEALEYAKAHNYSIRQAKNYFDSKDYDVKTNTGALLPQVSLDGVASRTRNYTDNISGVKEQDDLEWSVNMSIPLYEGGETRAKIRQSKYQKWQAQEQVLEAERLVTSNVTSAWEYMVANKAMITSIKEQVRANEIALDGVQKEEALGNRTILDVLDAYQELLNSNVEEVKARRNYYVSAMTLLQAMGRLTARDLGLNVELYNAEKYSAETRNKWLSLSIDK